MQYLSMKLSSNSVLLAYAIDIICKYIMYRLHITIIVDPIYILLNTIHAVVIVVGHDSVPQSLITTGGSD